MSLLEPSHRKKPKKDVKKCLPLYHLFWACSVHSFLSLVLALPKLPRRRNRCLFGSRLSCPLPAWRKLSGNKKLRKTNSHAGGERTSEVASCETTKQTGEHAPPKRRLRPCRRGEPALSVSALLASERVARRQAGFIYPYRRLDYNEPHRRGCIAAARQDAEQRALRAADGVASALMRN